LREDGGALLTGVDGVQHHQPRIIDPAIGINETAREFGLQRLARRTWLRRLMPEDAGSSSRRASISYKQAGADQPAAARRMRHHETQRPHDVRRARSSTSRSISALRTG
jgi:hypothetical protein